MSIILINCHELFKRNTTLFTVKGLKGSLPVIFINDNRHIPNEKLMAIDLPRRCGKPRQSDNM